ncbi:hypothetical protein [Streptomyces sp. CB00455]|uniref:hypothetical protein n=1 Tax=Streptomyces sp. CB00455 TaxID=1703927 RepID=UPI0011610947|nr:hypothetical protein [Streptomyces sp. CB00455]
MKRSSFGELLIAIRAAVVRRASVRMEGAPGGWAVVTRRPLPRQALRGATNLTIGCLGGAA